MSAPIIKTDHWVTNLESIKLRIAVLEQAFAKTPPYLIAEIHLFHVELALAYNILMQMASKKHLIQNNIAI